MLAVDTFGLAHEETRQFELVASLVAVHAWDAEALGHLFCRCHRAVVGSYDIDSAHLVPGGNLKQQPESGAKMLMHDWGSFGDLEVRSNGQCFDGSKTSVLLIRFFPSHE